MYMNRSVYKNFGRVEGKHLGRVSQYCPRLKCYGIVYDDGDREDLSHTEMTRVLISDDMRSKIEGKKQTEKEKVESMDEKGGKGIASVVNNPIGPHRCHHPHHHFVFTVAITTTLTQTRLPFRHGRRSEAITSEGRGVGGTVGH